jgi:hypothetical protein
MDDITKFYIVQQLVEALGDPKVVSVNWEQEAEPAFPNSFKEFTRSQKVLRVEIKYGPEPL